jgi:hypothetical protein
MRTFTDIEKRRPVWIALSELFLDTSFDDQDIARIAEQLAVSPYSLEDLDSILLSEVYPACRTNLYSITGEWAGFNTEWLEQEIRNGPNAFGRFWAATVGKWTVPTSVDWIAIRGRVIELRKKQAA